MARLLTVAYALIGAALFYTPAPTAAFEVDILPSTYANPAVGQTLDMQIELSEVPKIAGAYATVIYNPHYYSFDEFVPGNLLEGVDSIFTVPSEVDSVAVAIVGGVTADFTVSNSDSASTLGTVRFTVLQPIPVTLDRISLIAVQLLPFIQLDSPDPPDLSDSPLLLEFVPGQLSLQITRRFSNRAFNFKVERRDLGATVGWQTRFTGLDDTLRYRRVGDTEYRLALNPLLQNLPPRPLQGVRLLGAARLDPRQVGDDSLDAFFGTLDFSPLSTSFYDSLRQAQQGLANRRREIVIEGLEAQTTYEYLAHSVSLDGRPTPQESGTFRTRAEPDVRPIIGTDVDVQPTATTASASWLTNRPADTRFAVFSTGGDTAEVVFDGADGSLVHNAPIDGLSPGREYNYIIRSRLVGVEALVERGLLDSSQIWLTKTGTFRTRPGREPLRLLEPPTQVLGPDNAVIHFRLNQITDAVVEYGLVPEGSGKITRGSQADDAQLYVWKQASTNLLDSHTITLSSLQPSTPLRYRIRVTTPDGDTLSTDPRGNDQWSNDLQFTTAAAGDTLAPRIVEGPAVIVRDVLAVVRFKTDVATSARVFFGTRGGTYGTADEFEFIDQTPDGNPRFSLEHAVTIGGLEAGVEYEYGIEVTAANGKTTSFEPSLNVAKPAGVLQPPGGAGRFVTRRLRDTRFPVILSGPTVASKTHSSAIIEWATDEPANSKVRFGADGDESSATSGSNKTRHRIRLTNLEPGTAYRFTAASTDASGNGETRSAEALFETEPEIDLTAPVILGLPRVVHRTERSATIEWRTDEVATGQIAFGPAGSNTALGFRRKLQETGRRHRVTLTNLEAATAYEYRVSSSDLSNNGPTQSGRLQFTTDAEPDLTPPTMGNIRIAANRKRAIVRWNTDELADSFVDFGVGGSGLALAKAADANPQAAFFQQEGSLDQKVGSIEDVSEHEIVLTNLEPGTTYFLRAGSTDPSDNPPTFSDVLAFTTPSDADAEPPAAPAGLTGEAGFERASLRWRANTELDLAGYRIYRRPAGGDFALIETGVQDTALVDAGLANGVAYQYRISAVDRALEPNESAFSDTLELVPSVDAAPSVPQRLTVDDASLQPTLSFDNAEPARQGAPLTYTVQVSTLEDFGNVTASVSDLTPGEDGRTGWTLPRTLRAGQTYFWQVRAVEDGLPGAFSPAQSFVAGQSTQLSGDFSGDGQVNFDDFFAFADAFGQPPSGEAARFDLNNDGQIGFADFFAFADQFGLGAAGKSWAAPAVLEERASVWIETAGGTRRDGNVATVRLMTDGTQGLGGFGLVLEYDDAVLRLLDARPGAGHLLESQGGKAPLFRLLSRAPGRLVLGNALVSGPPPSGGGLLAELRFRRQGDAGDAFFDLTDAFFYRDGEVAQVLNLASARLTPRTHSLGANYPNPFNPSTSIEYALPQPGKARLTVYDVLGRKVRTLLNEAAHPAGIFTARWDGRDQAGRAVGNGIYFYRLEAGDFSRTRKMALVK